MSMTDEELIQKHRSGDTEAFPELMKRWIAPVFRFVRPYAETDDVAEDIVQDSFIKAWKHLRRFDDAQRWKPWIFAIARNCALDHIKKKRPTLFSSLDTDDEGISFSETLEDAAPLAAELFERSEDVRALAAALGSLRPVYASVLMLHYHQELTFEEIAAIMAVPMNTVKSWHRRALGKLKMALPTSVAPK